MLTTEDLLNLQSKVHQRVLQLAAKVTNHVPKPVSIAQPSEQEWIGSPINVGSVFQFSKGNDCVDFLRDGWSIPEHGFTWTVAPSASIILPPISTREDILLVVAGTPYSPRGMPQRLSLHTNGKAIAIWEISSRSHLCAWLPICYLKPNERWTLVFNISNPISPSNAGLSDDDRPLGFALESLAVFSF